MRTRRTLTLALAALAALPAAASAAAPPASLPAVKRTLTERFTAKRDCADAQRASARGIATQTYRAPMAGFVSVRGTASDRSDWDLTVLDAASRTPLGTSQGFGSHEVVQTWVDAGQRLAIQACRRKGSARSFRTRVKFFDVTPPRLEGTPSLVSVRYQSNRDLERMEAIGLDLTHDIQDGRANVIVSGAKEMAALKGLGLSTGMKTVVPDLNALSAQNRSTDLKLAAAGASPLPTGRDTYRNYADFQTELKALAEQHPGLVKPVVLPKKSFQGRELQGVEISKDVNRTDDGKPVYLVVALHHAREWPSAEAAMEFAHLLAERYGSDARITSLLSRERVVVVPLINPDGYVESRGESRGGLDPADASGIGDLQTVEGVALLGGSLAYRRKNCDGAIPSGDVPCTLQYGIDPNRNYGQGWGGRGAGADPLTQSYRGTGPWSEPETQAVHEFSQLRQITNIITIHNVAALVLRPPGISDAGKAPDEPRLKEIGDQMAAATGYTSQYSFQLYDTSGTTEDWNYAAQGAYGYTIEMGPAGGEFHMPYQVGVIDEWTGKTGTPTEGKGMKEALLIGAEAAANASDHSVLTGKAAPGNVLRLRKDFITETGAVCAYAQGYLNSSGGGTPADCIAPGEKQQIPDFLETTMTVPASGAFTWHVNPSTRPFVGARYVDGGFTPYGTPQTFTPTDDENKLALGAADEEQGSVERTFSVSDADAAAADRMTVKLEWAAAPQDYDLKLFKVEADGSRTPIGSGGSSPGSSGNAPGTFEQLFVEDPQPGTYVLRVIYYTTLANDWTASVGFEQAQPDSVEPTGKTEAWTLTCEAPDGKVLATRQVTVARGQSQAVDLAGCGKQKKPKKPRK
jgi:Zinc carboxypeptidase